MIYFTVTENINVKLADGELVKYLKLKNPSELVTDFIYCASYDEIGSLKALFKRVGVKYRVKILKEEVVKQHKNFPIELGIKNTEYNLVTNHPKDKQIEDKSFLLDSKEVQLSKQLTIKKSNVKVAIIGGIGRNIGEIISSYPAIRHLYEYLNKKHKLASIDMYIEAGENKFYHRDKDILEMYKVFTHVRPMSISLKKLMDYDYYIDTCSLPKISFYEKLGYVDSYLYKFGFEPESISKLKKYNEIELKHYTPSKELKEKVTEIKTKGKVLLFHPFSADIKRSMPEEVAKRLITEFSDMSDEYIVISLLQINGLKHKNHEDLTKFSKSVFDFFYIISQCDKIITVDTATYHISEAFFIPTLALFVDSDYEKRVKYYEFVTPLYLKSKKKNLSKFKFEDDSLSIYKYDNWKSLKAKKLLKLLSV